MKISNILLMASILCMHTLSYSSSGKVVRDIAQLWVNKTAPAIIGNKTAQGIALKISKTIQYDTGAGIPKNALEQKLQDNRMADYQEYFNYLDEMGNSNAYGLSSFTAKQNKDPLTAEQIKLFHSIVESNLDTERDMIDADRKANKKSPKVNGEIKSESDSSGFDENGRDINGNLKEID